MTSRHLTKRQAVPGRRFTWARIPMGESGYVCYRLVMRDRTGVQHIETLNFWRDEMRGRIAKSVMHGRRHLFLSVKALEQIL